MNNPTLEGVHEIAAFTFPAIVGNKIIDVKIVDKCTGYEVLIDGVSTAHLQYNSQLQRWQTSHGQVNDMRLLAKIGERIEAKYN
jgi:hypothetical protein